MITFESLGLSGETLQGVFAAGYTTPTPIQTQAIPIAQAGMAKGMCYCPTKGASKKKLPFFRVEMADGKWQIANGR